MTFHGRPDFAAIRRLGGLGALVCLGLILAPADLPARSLACEDGAAASSFGTVNLRLDNDLFGGTRQDQGYTSGIHATWVSPEVQDDDCLPGPVRGLGRFLDWLRPDGFEAQSVTAGISQMMYTPTDPERRDLIRDDRPYAGALMVNLGYSARKGRDFRYSQVRLGMVGPASLAGAAHTAYHDLINQKHFRGWKNQIHNEPVVQLVHERRRRLARRLGTAGSLDWDLIGHAGASLGNFATYANTGLEFRIGYSLPDNFGTAHLRPAGEDTTPAGHSSDGWAGHLFVGFDVRGVAYDITLDGNLFRSSHHVDKKPLVADLGYGLALTHGPWRFAFGRYHRTREFDGQSESPVYGTIVIGRRF